MFDLMDQLTDDDERLFWHDPHTQLLVLRERGEGACGCGDHTPYLCASCGEPLCSVCASDRCKNRGAKS